MGNKGVEIMEQLRASPQRRVCARLIDALWIVPGGLLLWRSLAVFTELSWEWQITSFALLTSILQLAVEPIFLSFFGATPGKALLGVAITHVDSGRSLSYGAALGRTVKVVGLGLGFWLLPLTLISLLAVYWRARTSRGVPWDLDAADGCVCVQSNWQLGRASWSITAAVVVGWVLPVAVWLFCIVIIGAKGIDAGQDLSRAITGRWLWLHRLSGEMITLDARWRVQHDRLDLRYGSWNAVFVFGTGDENRVMFDLDLGKNAQRKRFTSPCISKQLAMEDEGFVFFKEIGLDGESCIVSGGKPSSAGAVLVRIDGHRSGASDYSLTQVYRYEDTQAREGVTALARRLWAEQGNVQGLDSPALAHYWRNELTGMVARIPGGWEYVQRNVNGNGSLVFEFQRIGPGAPIEQLVLLAFPWDFFGYGTDPHASLEDLYLTETQSSHRLRRNLNTHDRLTTGKMNSGEIHLWSGGAHFDTWAAVWDSGQSSLPTRDPMLHPLFRELQGTIR